MSGFVCVFALNDSQALEHAFHRICDAAAYHGPEPCQRWSSGPVALGHVALRTTPESELESQPTPTRDAALCLSFDGRLDNRSALLPLLLPTSTPERTTDVDLVLAAYQRWGEACLEHFVGDYAFVLWDARLQRVFCARDPLGVRPFYYATLGSTFYAASGLEELLQGSAIPRDVNEAMVAEYLTGELYSTSETLYRHVQRLPPGHQLTVDARAVRVSRHWYPERIPESTLAPDEAAARFKALFEQAVKACARTNRPFAAQLSGGLDSSSIVSVLSLLRDRGSEQQPFEAFTMTFPGLACDEAAYAQAVTTRHHVDWNPVCTEPLPPVDYEELAARHVDFPGYPNGMCALGLARDVRRKGMRVVLGGSGGDEWLDRAPAAARVLDSLLRGHWQALRAEWDAASAKEGFAGAARLLLAHGLHTLQIQAPKRAYRRRFLPRWLPSSFVRRTNLVARVSPPILRPSGWSWSRACRLHYGTNGACAHAMELEARMYSHLQLEERHPFYDRRLVEFMMSLPERYCGGPGVNRWLLREAMRGILPEAVRTRSTKADFSHAFQRSLATPHARLTLSKGQPARDWINGTVAERELERFLRGETRRGLWSLWSAYGIQVWASTLHL